MPQYQSPGVYVEEVAGGVQPIAGVGTSTAGFVGIVPDQVTVPERNPAFDPTQPVSDTNRPYVDTTVAVTAPLNQPVLVTNFAAFVRAFGGFSTDAGQSRLAHGVYGFFLNGGTRCYVVRTADNAGVQGAALAALEAVDEVAIVAVPGNTTPAVWSAVLDHCESLQDRFAVLDGPEDLANDDLADFDSDAAHTRPRDSSYGAVYFPWLQEFDQATATRDPNGPGLATVPPSGHVAGIYARVDATRGVHKAPANEVVRGALDLRYRISRPQQDGLNPTGINVIRALNGATRVWGARTIGGDRQGEWKYVNVRRLFLFLRESLDQGLQWTVFEPNDARLWKKIERNVDAFLLGVWRDGALFGASPAEAYYVKCDEETNPPDVRDAGQVVTEVGVAIVRPAEFVVIRIQQWAGPPAA
jgi:phage tail sheath protein FI